MWDGREWIDPPAFSAADDARVQGGCRRFDRRGTLICHGRPARPLPIAPLAAAVRLSAFLTLLIAAVGLVPLSAPGRGSTRWPAIALATVAADADSEYRPALRVATYSQPKNSIPVNARMGHSEIMPSARPEVKSHRQRRGLMIGPMTRAFGADDVAGPRPRVQKTTFSDDC